MLRQTDVLLLLGLRLWNASTARDGTWELPLKPLRRVSSVGVLQGRSEEEDTTRILGRCACKRVPAYQLTHTEPLPTQVENWCGIKRVAGGTKKRKSLVNRRPAKTIIDPRIAIGKRPEGCPPVNPPGSAPIAIPSSCSTEPLKKARVAFASDC